MFLTRLHHSHGYMIKAKSKPTILIHAFKSGHFMLIIIEIFTLLLNSQVRLSGQIVRLWVDTISNEGCVQFNYKHDLKYLTALFRTSIKRGFRCSDIQTNYKETNYPSSLQRSVCTRGSQTTNRTCFKFDQDVRLQFILMYWYRNSTISTLWLADIATWQTLTIHDSYLNYHAD